MNEAYMSFSFRRRGENSCTWSMSSLFLLVLLAPATLLSAPAFAENSLAKRHSLFVPASSLSYETLTLKYGVESLDAEGVEKYLDENGLNGKSHRTVLDSTSFLQTATKALAKVGVIANGCEICNYVMENKQMHQPFLCRGLKDPAQQQTCVSVLISMMWWLENTVYWNNYGCQRQQGGGFEWVKPCPSHATCGWIQNLYDRSQYCPSDPAYRKPGA